MLMLTEQLNEIYRLLYASYGSQHWWPASSGFEVIIGAVLTQNTNWGNVEKALANLKKTGLLKPEKLRDIKIEKLAELIRPAGYFNIKANRLKNLVNWLFENYQGCIENLDSAGTRRLRDELLSVKGIGPETADSILLYALDRPVFVVDAYTARVMARHHLIEPPFDYEQLQELFASNLPQDFKLFNEYHALLVKVGKEHCKPKARCSGCPLEKLPHTIDEQ